MLTFFISELTSQLDHVCGLRRVCNIRIELRCLALMFECEQNGLPHGKMVVNPADVDGLWAFVAAPLKVPWCVVWERYAFTHLSEAN